MHLLLLVTEVTSDHSFFLQCFVDLNLIMEQKQQYELQRVITGPVSAKIETRDDASFLVFSDKVVEEDSDEEDMDRYADTGLREQIYILLCRVIRMEQNAESHSKITESAIPDSIKNKRAPQRRKLNQNSSGTANSSSPPTVSASKPKKTYSKYGGTTKSQPLPKGPKPSSPPRNVSEQGIHSKYKSSQILKHYETTPNVHFHPPVSPPTDPSSPKTPKRGHRKLGSNLREYSPRLNGCSQSEKSVLHHDAIQLNHEDIQSVNNASSPSPAFTPSSTASPSRHTAPPVLSSSSPMAIASTSTSKWHHQSHHNRKSEMNVTLTLEQVRLQQSEERIQSLPAVSQTPKGSRGGRIRIANKFKNSSHPNLHGHVQRVPPSIPPPPPPDAPYGQHFMQQISPRLHVNSMSAVQIPPNSSIPPPPNSPPPDLPHSHRKYKNTQKHNGFNAMNGSSGHSGNSPIPKQRSYNEAPIPMYTKPEPARPLPQLQQFLSSPNLAQPPDLSKQSNASHSRSHSRNAVDLKKSEGAHHGTQQAAHQRTTSRGIPPPPGQPDIFMQQNKKLMTGRPRSQKIRPQHFAHSLPSAPSAPMSVPTRRSRVTIDTKYNSMSSNVFAQVLASLRFLSASDSFFVSQST